MAVLDRPNVLSIMRATLAADCACDPTCFDRDDVCIVEARVIPGRRRALVWSNPLTLVTTGRGVVISCGAAWLPWVREQLSQRRRDELFSLPTLALISHVATRAGQELDGPFLRLLCASNTLREVPPPSGITIELIARPEIERAYSYPGFRNALSYQLDHDRPDVLAAVAWQRGAVVGMAGAGADSDQIWQVGVDVLPPYQGQSIGKALVSRISAAILAAGRVPYYATRVSNLRSSSTALGVGYWLAWVDAFARDP